jgi:ribosomal protein L11 methyltransferase
VVLQNAMQDSIDLVAGADAFGDGSHPSTKLLLAAIEALDPTSFAPKTACDMGCGAGLLALRMAQRFGCMVVAVDIERSAIQATQKNAQANDLADAVIAVHSDGFAHRNIRQHAPFDMVAMNILPDILLQHAHAATEATADNGLLVLSGILRAREEEVLHGYQSLGCALLHKLRLEDWVALVFEKG